MKTFRLEIPRTELRDVLNKNFLTPVGNSGAYILHYFKDRNGEFTVYDNTKNAPYKAIYKALRLPPFLKYYLLETIDDTPQKTVELKKDTLFVDEIEQIGSDEVGFGDFFGPLVVCSAYLNSSLREQLTFLKIKDSKKISDDEIIILGDKLKDVIPHIKNIVANPKYNELITKGYNMNKMKAILHHNVLLKLQDKTHYTGMLYIDKFVEMPKFNEYIHALRPGNFLLVPSGEENALSIAVASILARYYFLLEIDKLNTRFQTKIPLGAGRNVDEFAKAFLAEKGPSNLKMVTKHNFRNFKDLFGV